MKKIMMIVLCLGMLNACRSTPISEEAPAEVVVPEQAVTVAEPVAVKPAQPTQYQQMREQVKKTHSLGIIGAVEPVRFPPMKGALEARIDTGAEKSSLDAQNIREFERDGKKWVSFTLTNPKTKETHQFEKKIYRQTVIKRQLKDETRIVVLMTIQIGKEKLTTSFSLADRSRFEYPVLIGRNILKGRAVVDTARSHTLY